MKLGAILCGLLATVPPQAGPEKKAAKAHFEQAERDYRLGRFEPALASYAKAYELYPEPAFLFNIGQCHRNLDRHEPALFFFRSYLREAPAAPDRVGVERLIRELELKQLDAEALERAAAARAGSATTSVSDPLLAPLHPTPERAGENEEPPFFSSNWPWLVLIGAVAIGGTVAIAVIAQGREEPVPPGASLIDWSNL